MIFNRMNGSQFAVSVTLLCSSRYNKAEVPLVDLSFDSLLHLPTFSTSYQIKQDVINTLQSRGDQRFR